MHPHIYLILPPEQILYEESTATPVAPTQFQLGVLLQRSQDFRAGESSRAARDSQSQPPPTRRPILASSPIEGNSDCRARAFHDEAYFDHYVLRQQPDLGDSYRLLERYHLVPFMTPPQFFYPRVALDFYQSMTTRGVPTPASILFTIDGRQGILGARQIAEAFHIPYALADPAAFRRWAPLSEWDMTLILRPAPLSRELLLDQWNQVLHHQHSPELPSQGKFLHSPYHLYLLRPLQLPRSPYQRQHRLMPHLLFLLPRAAHYYPCAEYRDLLASFQTLTTTQTAIMERMDHFQLRQDQQTLILREIQQHLGLLPPAPPVSPMPSEPFASADDFDQ
ncbi:hypothetical protein CK203_048370 [Vitis vinifera]|uniref:Uncharacterized protein n=1 Tax=Vitis vinifera TaxID=29760 RepID=A0A438HRH5_VITVI|nr:hypothetical protein CK203_048370 [Vitis vinifera]